MPKWTREMLIALADEVCARADAADAAEKLLKGRPEQHELPLGPGGNVLPFRPRPRAPSDAGSALERKSV